ncbi:MAG: hypothetical protein EBX66_09655, partial [Betaproteobacteria bacterium]|nr:hypothetical protein [Betaproteobacteria bacterium]
PNQIIQFRQHALEHMAELFEKDKAPKPSGISGDDLKDLHAKIGQLTEVRHLWAKKGCFGLRFGIAV